MILEAILPNVINTINTAVISNYSQHAVNAVGTVGSLMGMMYLLAAVVGTGATVVINNDIGTRRERSVREGAFSALLLCLMLGVVGSVLLCLFSPQLLSYMNLTGKTYEYGLYYLRFLSATYFLNVVSVIVLALLRCFGFPKYSVVITVLGGGLKLLMTVWFLRMPDYAPVTGIAGLCAAALLSVLFQLFISFFAVKKAGIRFQKPKGIGSFARCAGRMLKIGIPTVISTGSATVSGVVTTSFVAAMGDDALLAQTCINTLISYTHLFSYNVGNANALLTGRLCGSGNYEKVRRMNFSLVKIAGLVNFMVALIVLIFYKPLIMSFTDDPVVIRMCVVPLGLNLITVLARAISHVYEHSLRAAGDVTTVMVVTLLSCWIVAVGFSYLTGVVWQMGVVGYFIGIMFDEIVRTAVSLIRWRSNRWTLVKL